MLSPPVLELIGYLASALVAVSLMMRSVLRLRVLNLFGAATFAVYGVLIGAIPVAVVNVLIVLINVYYLRQMLASREFFRLLEVRPESDYLRAFLDHHRDEIARFVPGFRHDAGSDHLIFFVLRDLVPAGVFIGERGPAGTLRVLLDFVTPQYRDFRTGRYVFRDQDDFFRTQGIRAIESEAGNPTHEAYLRRMGFAPAGGLYRLDLA
jgi:hypothetical protein